MAKSRTLNIQASYFKKVGLKHCMMKARNALKKIGRDRDSDVNRGGIAGLREKKKKQAGRRDLRTLLWPLVIQGACLAHPLSSSKGA